MQTLRPERAGLLTDIPSVTTGCRTGDLLASVKGHDSIIPVTENALVISERYLYAQGASELCTKCAKVLCSLYANTT